MTTGEHPKSALTAWERWELASFDSAADSAGSALTASGPAPGSPDDIQRLRDQARQEGHQAGYAAGLAQGLAAGQAQAEAMGRQEASRLVQTLENLERCIAELNHAVGDDLLALSIEVTRQIVRQTVAARPEVIMKVIDEALEQLPLLHAVIHLHPEDASLARLRAGDQLAHAGHRIHEDSRLKRGDVVIEAGGSHIDASLATRWRRVIESLGQDAPWIEIQAGAAVGPGFAQKSPGESLPDSDINSDTANQK
jgi:flagellar assembly protein FliH